jgi:uncharacterized protein YndB with AHSA1/START domain
MTEQTASYELFVSRILTAPRPAVYRAFAEPAQVVQWLGPQGWSVSAEDAEFDVRPGGRQRFEMIKTNDPYHRVLVDVILDELTDGERLVGHQVARAGAGMHLWLEFNEEPGTKTRLELRQGPYTLEQETDARAWWNSSLGKLDVMLESAGSHPG